MWGEQDGGYLNSSRFSSPQASQEKRTRSRAQNLVPCTVAQIIGAEQKDDTYVMNNVQLNQVTLVGIVRTVSEQATRLDYHIDDMTGPPLEVKQFLEDDDNTPAEDRTIPARENTYVRVFGNVRSFQGKRSIVAFKIRPITDMNELTTHLLEVVQASLYANKAQSGVSTIQAGNVSNMADTSSGYAGAHSDVMNGLNPVQKQVEMVIRSCKDDQGISIKHISEKLRGIPLATIKSAVDFLSGEGHIYSTIDDDHFKSTESGDD